MPHSLVKMLVESSGYSLAAVCNSTLALHVLKLLSFSLGSKLFWSSFPRVSRPEHFLRLSECTKF